MGGEEEGFCFFGRVGEAGKLELAQVLAGFERGYGRPPSGAAMSSSATSSMMRDEDDGGGGLVREGELERLMRSLSEDMSSQVTQQNQSDYLMSPALQRDFSSSFSQSQPSFLLELLSMPAPAAGWHPNPGSLALPDAAPGLHSTTMNLHGFLGTQATQGLQQRPQESIFWDTLPEYPSWFPAQDGLQELLTAPAAWNDHPAVSTTTTVAPNPKTSTHSSGISSVFHSPLASPVMGSTSPSSPPRLNSAAPTPTLPSTPNSSMSSGSVSDAAAEEDHSHRGDRSSTARPSSQQPQAAPGPSGSSSAKRKTTDQSPDEDEIQSLASKKP